MNGISEADLAAESFLRCGSPILESTMKGKLLEMPAAKTAEAFSRTVPTIEKAVNFQIQAVANEDGSCPMCMVDLPNPGPHGGICRALPTCEQVDLLIEALEAWQELQ